MGGPRRRIFPLRQLQAQVEEELSKVHFKEQEADLLPASSRPSEDRDHHVLNSSR